MQKFFALFLLLFTPVILWRKPMYKFVALFLSLLYVCAFSGATVTVHYCSGTVSSISVTEALQDKDCHKCVKKEKSCCQDKQTVLKIGGKHEPSLQQSSYERLKLAVAGKQLHSFFVDNYKITKATHLAVNCQISPPLPLYISYCTYRI